MTVEHPEHESSDAPVAFVVLDAAFVAPAIACGTDWARLVLVLIGALTLAAAVAAVRHHIITRRDR